MRYKKWDPPEVPEGIEVRGEVSVGKASDPAFIEDLVPEEALSTDDVEGEPATIDDEFAKEDAPKQEYEDG